MHDYRNLCWITWQFASCTIDATIQLFIRVRVKPFIVLQEFFLTVQLKQLSPRYQLV